MKIRKLQNKGFTIVELLIVIIIIGILATIGFLSFANAQNKAKHGKAQTVLEQTKTKLGEYYSDNSDYPLTKAAIVTYLNDTTKGNSPALATDFGATGYTYTASPAGCDNSATLCTGFTITADKTIWGSSNPSTNETVTN